MKNETRRLAIIGGGNLGSAIAAGVISSGLFEPSAITITRRRTGLLSKFAAQGVTVTGDNVQAAANADIIVLAIKPFQIEKVCSEIKNAVSPGTIIVSVATGVSLATLAGYFGNGMPIYRAMPNTAIEIGESMTCIASSNGNESIDQVVTEIFGKLGIAVMIPEELMGSATALGSCGIAFALRFIRAATQAGIEIGFGAKLASQIVSQTVKGAADLIIHNQTHPEEEIDKVTTPRGVTISGLNEMEHNGFSSSLIKGVITSFNKIEGLNK